MANQFEDFPDLVLSHVADLLCPEDIARLSQTCHRLHSVLPHFMIIHGEDFEIRGPRSGHWAPELYFDGPILPSIVKKLSLSVVWDQSYGNRKGEIFLQLMRRPNTSSSPVMVTEERRVFGIAEHHEIKANAELSDHPVVKLAQPAW